MRDPIFSSFSILITDSLHPSLYLYCACHFRRIHSVSFNFQFLIVITSFESIYIRRRCRCCCRCTANLKENFKREHINRSLHRLYWMNIDSSSYDNRVYCNCADVVLIRHRIVYGSSSVRATQYVSMNSLDTVAEVPHSVVTTIIIINIAHMAACARQPKSLDVRTTRLISPRATTLLHKSSRTKSQSSLSVTHVCVCIVSHFFLFCCVHSSTSFVSLAVNFHFCHFHRLSHRQILLTLWFLWECNIIFRFHSRSPLSLLSAPLRINSIHYILFIFIWFAWTLLESTI